MNSKSPSGSSQVSSSLAYSLPRSLLVPFEAAVAVVDVVVVVYVFSLFPEERQSSLSPQSPAR